MSTRKKTQGFTLIELMITLAIVGILAAIAYPTYHQFVLKGRRAEGRAALTTLLQQQERYYTQYGKYYLDDSGPTPFKTYSGDSPATSAYVITNNRCADDLTASDCVLIQAAPTRNDDPDVGNLTISSVGPTRSCSGSKKDLCWK